MDERYNRLPDAEEYRQGNKMDIYSIMAELKGEPLGDGGFVDIHSHILPGLDDGAVALEESVEMARAAVERGTTAIIATPHLNHVYDWDAEALERVVDALNAALLAEGVSLTVYGGAEVLASPEIFERLEKDDLPTLAGSRHLLIEMPFEDVPFYMGDLTFKLRLKGYTPVLAHPERTSTVRRRPARLEPLIDQGCLIQLDASSLNGGFGPDFSTASKILRKGWAFAVGSDAHDLEIRPPDLTGALHAASRLIGKGGALALVKDNPRKLIPQ